MKLHELAEQQPSKQISKVFESYFGSKIQIDNLNARQTQHMLSRVRGLLSEHRSTSARHHSEKNPSYLKLVMLEQALVAQQQQQAAAPGTVPAGTAPAANPAQTAALATAQQQQKKKQIQDQIKQKQKEIADLQKAMNNPLAMAENRLRRSYNLLKESEVQQAQVVLAAQDMVDKMQGMLEDVSELQFKELPALVDSIKNQVGIDQAQQFNTDATAALTGLLQNIQGAKQQLDAALGVVTGQAPAAGAADMAAGAGMDAAGAADMGAGAADDLGAMDDLDAAAADAGDEMDSGPSGAVLGRAKR